jgi:hypothetical protein
VVLGALTLVCRNNFLGLPIWRGYKYLIDCELNIFSFLITKVIPETIATMTDDYVQN